MTYKELYDDAIRQLESGKITVGEFDKRVEPLNAEVRKNGKWIIEKWEPQDIYEHALCSECGTYWSDPILVESFDYCPTCGAKMKG